MSSERRDSGNEFLRGPKWRTRTSAAARHRAAAFSFALVVVAGLIPVTLCVWLLGWVDAPTWVVVLPWLVPTAAAVAWTLVHPTVAEVSDDDDDSWFGYAIRWALVGELEPRPAPVRLVCAGLFGAPVVWAVSATGLLTLTGLL